MTTLSHNTQNSITQLTTWLNVSKEIISSIENESKPTTQQIHRVGQEWAGTLSRLEQLH